MDRRLGIALLAIVTCSASALIPSLRSRDPVGVTENVGAGAPDADKRIVVPDLAARLGKFKRVKMPLQSAGLTRRERQMLEKLVDAAGYLEDIYWRQSDSQGLLLYLSLARSHNPQDDILRRYLWINAGRFDLIDGDKPFVGTDPMPPGRGFYPPDMTRKDIEKFLAQHPESRAEIYGLYTLVRLRAAKGSPNTNEPVGVPYHVAFKEFLEPMAKDLREAADLSDDPAFARFLRMRAHALLTDDFYPSDIAWLELENPKFDVIFGPYETYLDGLLGVKTSYGAAVMIRNEEESKKLAVFQKYVPDLQEALPLPAADLPSKRGRQTPMEVMDTPFRAGDLGHGYQAVADNLPNDPRIHEEKGSKKIFFKNFMDARVNDVILPLAQRVMRPDQAALASGEGYLAATMMHEISHGLGPVYARTSTGRVGIREAIGPQSSSLEEAKADIVGLFGLKWLVDHGALPREKLAEYYASDFAGIFRTVRFGIAEAHGQAEMMEFNYLSEEKAILWDAASGRYVLDFEKMPAAIGALAKELLEMEATGDRARAESWFQRYAVLPPNLAAALDKASDIPIDIDPTFSFSPPVR